MHKFLQFIFMFNNIFILIIIYLHAVIKIQDYVEILCLLREISL
jgi:hypothetical protein